MSALNAAPAPPRPTQIQEALGLHSGARFYRAALQVNPFAYLADHSRASAAFTDEHDYNTAIVAACVSNGIEVIAVTDHHRIRSSQTLIEAARAAGITVFPGFEATTKDGLHLLCLFDPDRPLDVIDRALGQCEILEEAHRNRPVCFDVPDFIDHAREWGAVCVAAHVTAPNDGLRSMAKGQPRAVAWKTEDLLACAIPGPVKDVPDEMRNIILNTDPAYKRTHAIAVINAADVSDPSDLLRPATSTYIKMSEITVEGLRQAFLDPESRVRLASDSLPEEHVELVALTWQGGFLDGTGIHFNENLNVLIGGRGAGKSTVIEALRYVLGLTTSAEEAERLHNVIISGVLRAGTKVSLLVRAHRPTPRDYLIERTVGTGKAVVRDAADGKQLDIGPSDVLPGIEIFGQHEISEMTRHPEQLTRLLQRFMDRDPVRDQAKRSLAAKLLTNRRAIVDTLADIATTEDALTALPALEEKLRRYDDAGLNEKLAERREVELDDAHLAGLTRQVDGLGVGVADARGVLPKTAKARAASAQQPLLAEAELAVAELVKYVTAQFNGIDAAVATAKAKVEDVRTRWKAATAPVEERYRGMLRDLQRTKINGDDYIATERQIADLKPLAAKLEDLQDRIQILKAARAEHLHAWDDAKAEEFRATQKAADAVNKRLAGRVRVRVTFAGDRELLVGLLDDNLGGRRIETLEAARTAGQSPSEFAANIRGGKDALSKAYGLTPTQAANLASLKPDVVMQIEELDLAPATDLDLNTASKDQTVTWRSLAKLSTGQRATTVLLLLLLQSDAPLVIDQPEDDLDNRFIFDEVVPRMKQEKRRRQFLFATHNANIPVLADAELILGMSATADGATIAPEHRGAIDATSVRELVEEVLEGGQEAFLLRKRKYRF